MEGLRRTFGMAEPIRRGMELKLTSAGEWRPAALGGASNVHGDILSGRDTEIDWEDVYKGKSCPKSSCFVQPLPKGVSDGCVWVSHCPNANFKKQEMNSARRQTSTPRWRHA
jgi:hypothetical protein